MCTHVHISEADSADMVDSVMMRQTSCGSCGSVINSWSLW